MPLSARTGEGTDALVAELEARMPEGPHYYPDGVVSDQPEGVLAAELLREKLLAQTHDELPHSIAVTAEEVEERETKDGPLLALRLVIRVERDSQKGIVIGKGASLLRQAGTEARARARSAARRARTPRDPRAGGSRLAAAGVVAGPPRSLTAGPPNPAIRPEITELRSGESAVVESPRVGSHPRSCLREDGRCWTANNGSGAGL